MFTILTETVLGALTGYVTNDIATRQLFRRGGIVEREREGFTDMLVDMLSTEILGPEVMAEIFSDPKVESVFHRVAIALVDEVVPQVLAGVKLKDGLAGAMLYDVFQAKVDATKWPQMIWNQEALQHHLDTFLRSDDFYQAVGSSLEAVAYHSPSDLGLWPLVRNRVLSHPLLNQSTSLLWLDDNEERIRSRINDVTTLILEHEKWQKLPLGEWLHIDAEELCKRLLVLLKDEKTVAAAFETWRSWWLNDETREWSGEFLHRVLEEVIDLHLYDALAALVSALQEDREVIEDMVLRSIEAALDGLAFEPAALRAAREWFAGDGESDWLSHFFIEQSRTSRQRILRDRLVAQLESNMLPKLQALWTDSNEGARITEWLYLHADDFLRPLLLKLAQKVLQRSPAVWLKALIERERIDDWLWQLLKQLVSDEQWADALKARIAIVMSKPLRDTILTKEVQQDMVHRLQQLPDVIDSEVIGQILAAKPLSSETIIRRWGNWLFRIPLLDGAAIFMEHTPVHDVLQEVLAGDISDHVLMTLPDKLAEISREQIDALSHDELRELALSIIGREMRPLAWLGGAVGSVVGAASGTALAIGGNYVDPAEQALWVQSGLFAARSGMYGAVGYGTNVLAVKGLFRPYEKHFIFQGLLPKNQIRFADKMRELTHEYVINEDIWQQTKGALGTYALHQGHRRLNAFAGHWQRHAEHYKEPVLNRLKMMDLKPILKTLDTRRLLEEVIDYIIQGDVFQQMMRRTSKLLAKTLVRDTVADGKWLHVLTKRLPSLILTLSEQDQVQHAEKRMCEKIINVDEKRLRGVLMSVATRVHMPRVGSPFYEQCWNFLVSGYDGLPQYLERNARNLSRRASKSIRKEMSFSMDLMFRLAGGDIYIRKAIEYFALQELPDYLDRRRPHYKHAFLTFCYDELAQRSLTEVGAVPSSDDARFLKTLLSDEKRCEDTAAWLHRYFWRQWLPALFESTDWLHLKQRMGYWLIQSEKHDMADKWLEWLNKRVNHILIQLSRDRIGAIADYMSDISVSPLVQTLASLRLSDVFSDESLGSFYDAVVRFEDDKLKDEFDQALAARMGVILDDAWPILAPLFDRFGREFLQEIQLPDVTYRQVCGLDSAHLEDLVRQIADPYFHHVERMGWFGAVVAIPATWMAFWLQ